MSFNSKIHALTLRRWFATAGVVLLWSGAGLVWAEKADRDRPMNIEADRLEHDDLKKVSVFQGRVIASKGTILLRGQLQLCPAKESPFPRLKRIKTVMREDWARLSVPTSAQPLLICLSVHPTRLFVGSVKPNGSTPTARLLLVLGSCPSGKALGLLLAQALAEAVNLMRVPGEIVTTW